jgi:hypothetical protein
MENRSRCENLRDAKFNFDPGKTYSLAELLKLAEAHHPETRLAWRSPAHLQVKNYR